MAYPTGDELITELPLSGKGVEEEEADARIARWQAKLEYEPTTDRQTALAEEIVSTGARADLERLQMSRAGYREAPGADATRKEANELLKAYNAMRSTEGEETGVATLRALPW